MRTPAPAYLAVVGVGVVLGAVALAQSAHPFGIPTADTPSPAAGIQAVPGSRAQGWAAQG